MLSTRRFAPGGRISQQFNLSEALDLQQKVKFV